LRGKKPEESASFEKTYAEDAQNEQFRGRNIKHDVTLKRDPRSGEARGHRRIRGEYGGWQSVDEMREAIAADIRKHREFEAKRLKQNQIGELLSRRA